MSDSRDGELVKYKDRQYPLHILKVALILKRKMWKSGYHVSVEEAIQEALDFDEGLRNAAHADPDEPIRAIIFIPTKRKEKDNE